MWNQWVNCPIKCCHAVQRSRIFDIDAVGEYWGRDVQRSDCGSVARRTDSVTECFRKLVLPRHARLAGQACGACACLCACPPKRRAQLFHVSKYKLGQGIRQQVPRGHLRGIKRDLENTDAGGGVVFSQVGDQQNKRKQYLLRAAVPHDREFWKRNVPVGTD